MLLTFILATVFATAVLSGVLGMAGGMILMAILVSTLSVAGAMIVHGVVQAVSNGSRAWFLRHHIQWRILPAYTLGAAAALAGFTALSLVPNAGVVLILVGAFPFAARWNARLSGLDVTRPATTLACGFTVTAAQLLAGASGPLLDAFYLNTPLSPPAGGRLQSHHPNPRPLGQAVLLRPHHRGGRGTARLVLRPSGHAGGGRRKIRGGAAPSLERRALPHGQRPGDPGHCGGVRGPRRVRTGGGLGLYD